MNTTRQEITALLKEGPHDAKEISRVLSIGEKEVFPHLDHIARSITSDGWRLRIDPCQCLSCGYSFKERKRFTRPGKCPVCRQTRIIPATYRIVRSR
ncbi:MAG: transcriptional regulator [Proteobacteria bacterium]|nr:transcriptional regulator [Pseudomonadota bacterium]MBU1739746.1 transcriptional regulator [Pseudomonadota bacterium]